jgi:hypothetical protein
LYLHLTVNNFASKKAAAQATRDVSRAQKQLEVRSRTPIRQLQTVLYDTVAALKTIEIIPRLLVAEPLQQGITASGRHVRRPPRFDT